MARYRIHSISPNVRPLFTIEDMCAKWSCSRASIYRAIKAGKLRATKIGSMTRIKPEDAEAAEQSL